MQTYLNLLKEVLETGESRPDRTGTGCRSVFGRTVRYDLADGFPLVTTKKVHYHSVLVELLWFIRGDTNTQFLHDHKVTIWDEWADTHGDLGPVYGKQWRSWEGMNGGSIDQLAKLMEDLRADPYSRRHILSAWNVADLDKMALPPCHMMAQFYVSESGALSCHLYQRSADIFLGVPFNIASYATLVMMMAKVLGLRPGSFIHTFGDLHLYENHVAQAKEQLGRRPLPLPWLDITMRPSLFDFQVQDFQLIDYRPHPAISAKVAV